MRSDGTPATIPLQVGDITANISLFYKSVLFPEVSSKAIVASDHFSFKLIDSFGAISTNVGVVTIPILSALTAVNLTHVTGIQAMGHVREEEPTVIRLRGRNHRGGQTWFVIKTLPAKGSLYQYSEFGDNAERLNFSSSGESVIP